MRREPEDDYFHAPDDDQNYNESRYYNFFDPDASPEDGSGGLGGFGGWIRMGNRPNEHYAEMTVCLYLPDGRVGFMFKRPHIEGHVAHDAGGLKFDVVAPYEEHRVSYDGDVCVLVNPRDMADPGRAFKTNPHEPCSIDLRLTAASDPSGGEPVYDEGEEPPPGTAHGFAKGHTEQQMAITGVVHVDGQRFDLDHGFGLRDHSWGPRVWQSIWWYRWVTASFGGRLGLACTIRGHQDDPDLRNVNGWVFDLDRYGDGRVVKVRDMQLTSDYDDDWFVRRSDVVLTTDDGHVYAMHGEVTSSIPLRNRREGMVTRLTEGMTRWTIDGRDGAGLSEYLDQIVDDVPVGTTVGC